MIHTRLQPLLALLALLGIVLVARLFQLQVLQHDVWAQEAARLVRYGHERPYRRGRILDAAGRVLARDEEVRTVELLYRDFRRAHPLGLVTHARSIVEGRPVPLTEARVQLVRWARELVALQPREVRELALGAARTRSDRALERPQRARRAVDLLFYLRRLLALDGDDERASWNALLALAAEESESRSFVALAAAVRRGEAPDGVEAELRALERRLVHSLERLEVLARWLQPAGAATSDPLGELIDKLERERRAVEDATAAKLFAEATGFAPGRVEVDTLLACFDLGWIAALVGWDGLRLTEWAETVRAGWQARWRDEECLPRLFWSLALDTQATPGPADFLARLGVVYQPEGALEAALEDGPRPWREVDELAVFADLSDLVEAEVPESALALGRAALPIQLAELRADPDDARLLPEGDGPGSFRALLAKASAGRGRSEVETLVELARTLNEAWELRFQETLREALDRTRRAAARDELGPEGGLLLGAAGRDRAAERAEYFLMDYGSRARPLATSELSYDVVYLLTRYEDDFPGFRVSERQARERIELDGDDVRPAERLIGQVMGPTLDDLLRQRRDAARLRDLKSRSDREDEEQEELQRLIGAVRLPREFRGVSGIEAYFEAELTGTNGFSETRGAAEVFGVRGDEITVRAPTDGADVVLTLDAGLQAAAQRCLRTPEVVDDASFDHVWQMHPVGAIVLLSADGDVLAAASEPDDQSVVFPDAKGERQVLAERTLTKRTFQPPGSCFKVFVAAWALEHGLDPSRTVTCGPIADGRAGYKNLRCWNTGGHGTLDLHQALVQSCNAYFAWLGETLDTADFAALCAQFGFGEPTGVRAAPPWAEEDPHDGLRRRRGLSEDLAGLARPKDGGELAESLRSMAANGLGVVEATPMQVARGMVTLAAGEKRALRLVKSIGGREVPHGAPTALAVGKRSLEFVRDAMRGVTEDARGTAHNALGRAQLGFAVAAKTGSADLQSRSDDEGRRVYRKHAWVAGWAPAEEAALVFVVFVHDTIATSSHGAVYVARQLLRQPEVLLWLADRGVDVSGVPAR